MRSELVRLFQTLPHPCGYYADRTAQNLVIDPACDHLPQIYTAALTKGFRRAGGHVYRPHCGPCRACVAARVPASEFRPDRSQRRCLKRNADLDVRLARAEYNDEYFELYRRYLDVRHHGGGMDDPDIEDFGRFLYTSWSPTYFIEMRLRERLLGVAVTDFAPTGLSAVYTFTIRPKPRAASAHSPSSSRLKSPRRATFLTSIWGSGSTRTRRWITRRAFSRSNCSAPTDGRLRSRP